MTDIGTPIPPPMDDINKLITQLEALDLSVSRHVGYVYDEAMTRHAGDKHHPERPDRVRSIHGHLSDCGMLEKVLIVPSRLASEEEMCLGHSRELVEAIFALEKNPTLIGNSSPESDGLVKQKQYLFPFDHDTYVCHGSVHAARLACGSVLSLVDAVIEGKVSSGFAAIRPPGHHACRDKSMGFCLINNVAIAAEYAIKRNFFEKVAVIDWDVHHGNGTSEILHASNQALFLSIHRYDKGKFYPGTGHLGDLGSDAGLGYTINLPIDGSFGDEEIEYCWNKVVLPALSNFQPQLVLVSAGFDAAENDPLGQCRVKCETYGRLTASLLEQQYKVILVLEGGYNLDSIAKCSVSCMHALLANPTPVHETAVSSPCSSISSDTSVRSVPAGVPKSSVVRMVNSLVKLVNDIPNGVKIPAPLEPLKPTVMPNNENLFLHSGGGHAGALVRSSDSTVSKTTTLREALCYALIAEANKSPLPVGTEERHVWEAELAIEKQRVKFGSRIDSFRNLSQFTCECVKIYFSSSKVVVVLKDLTHGFEPDHRLGVIDIKLGTEYFTPDHSPKHVLTRKQKAINSSAASLGIRLTACKCVDGFSVSKAKAAKMKLMEQIVPVVRRFLFASAETFDASLDTASRFASNLKAAFESKAIDLKLVASSLLLVIGKLKNSDKIQLRCHLVDLAHLFPPADNEDGFIKGCSSLISLFNEAREPSYESA